MSIDERLALLEANAPQIKQKSDRSRFVYALDRMSMAELDYLQSILEAHGANEIEDLPPEQQLAVNQLVSKAASRVIPQQ